ncbi:4-hydroxythreonine-4-phosphate dehydrogenase 2 [Pseudovibrio japonicus]|uniref:4-hydroxythreonine-4-phosphate dehydrogenase 2 n=1 Tax=Pseudovibrio japonicus TaxID=366534 RepID=A0ABQ3ERG1_9HYPH|nr:4-hydroxythreonine-4-phosphate dehydrogenase PdxA [Pseudovibrio japonicus]GHB46666.1 4-hydroxythreonine-4-phosphate dehydrogenase 2 [Pseudovibrio japonicus]
MQPIGITMGDASGISPEIILKALDADALKNTPLVIFGCFETFVAQNELMQITKRQFSRIDDVKEADFQSGKIFIIDVPLEQPAGLQFGKVQAQCGDAAYRCIEKATHFALKKQISAIATAPLNKEALHLAGHMYAGHTELLAELTNTRDYAMLLYTDKLRVIHVTTHISLRQMLDRLNPERQEIVVEIAERFLDKIGEKNAPIAVAGINPHAGENGLFGREELDVIAPVIEGLKNKGHNVHGPQPPDTVFLQAYEGKYAMVVAQYHDQGHIPLKLLGFHSGVNITAGLPFIRTSADHGTAFDIAGKNIAKCESIIESIKLAEKLIN